MNSNNQDIIQTIKHIKSCFDVCLDDFRYILSEKKDDIIIYYSLKAYDSIDDDLDFDENHYSHICNSLEQSLDKELKRILRDNHYQKVKITYDISNKLKSHENNNKFSTSIEKTIDKIDDKFYNITLSTISPFS